MHCMKSLKSTLLLTAMAIATIACKKNEPIPETGSNKKSGFVVHVQTPSQSYLVKYYENLPNGQVDVSDGKDFQRFSPTDIFQGAIFMGNPDRKQELSKVVVNSAGEVVVDKSIPVGDNSSWQLAIQSSDLGVFHDRSTPDKIGTFNPSTMAINGSIDMSAGFVPGVEPQRYQSFYFRGNELYSPLRPNVGGMYDSLAIQVANLSSGSYLKTITNSTSGMPTSDFGQNDLDETGNLYISDQGNPQVFPPQAAILHRINAGTNDIDKNYEFNIGAKLNPTNIFPVFNGFKYIGNNQAVALVATETPQSVLDIINNAGGVQNLTSTDLQTIFFLFFTEENAAWCLVDLSSKSVTPISGLPKVSSYATPSTSRDGSKLLIPITTQAENAMYSYDINTFATKKEFDVIGGDLIGTYNIGNDHNKMQQ